MKKLAIAEKINLKIEDLKNHFFSLDFDDERRLIIYKKFKKLMMKLDNLRILTRCNSIYISNFIV